MIRDKTFRLLDHDVDVVASDAAPREDRRKKSTLPVPALALAGEQVLTQRLPQLPIARPVLAEAVRLAQDLGRQLWRGGAVGRDTPSRRTRADAGESAHLAVRT